MKNHISFTKKDSILERGGHSTILLAILIIIRPEYFYLIGHFNLILKKVAALKTCLF